VAATSRGASVGRGRRIPPKLVVALLATTLMAIFIAQNREHVRIQLFTITLTSPLWLILVVMVVLGGIVGLLLSRWRRPAS
jgi:lipopolysaccharide assembly protein A